MSSSKKMIPRKAKVHRTKIGKQTTSVTARQTERRKPEFGVGISPADKTDARIPKKR